MQLKRAMRWRKFIDSSDKMWNSFSTFPPEELQTGDIITVKSLSMVIYKMEEI
jgi:hypothetical protein